MSESDPDADLLRRVSRGDAAAIQTLAICKVPRITALAFRMLGDGIEAEDVAQDAMLRVWRHASHWRAKGPAKFDTWLHKVVLNLCRDRLRRRREHTMAEPPDQIDPALPADRQIEISETSKRVQAALAELPARQREAILLSHYQELSNVEAAAILGIGVEALESLLTRGRRTLRTLLRGIES